MLFFNELAMKFFVLLSIFCTLLLGYTRSTGLFKTVPDPKRLPSFLLNYKYSIKNHFHKPENANLLFSFISGDKNGISFHTKNAFKKVNLSFLLSASGIHFSGFLFLIGFVIKRLGSKKLAKLINVFLIGSTFFLPSYDSIKRLSILRLLLKIKYFKKLKISLEVIFVFTFLSAALLGDFHRSPLGFIYSLFFLGTFFSLRNYSKLVLILGLFSTQLILGLFIGNKVSLLSIPIGLCGSFIFSIVFPLLLIFLATYWIIPINWGEPIIKTYVILIKKCATITNGSFTSPSVFLILAIWVLILMKSTHKKYALLTILLFFHTNTAMTPMVIH
jgi:hypothetical protein